MKFSKIAFDKGILTKIKLYHGDLVGYIITLTGDRYAKRSISVSLFLLGELLENFDGYIYVTDYSLRCFTLNLNYLYEIEPNEKMKKEILQLIRYIDSKEKEMNEFFNKGKTFQK